MTEKQSKTRSVDRALDILESFLYGKESMTLAEIAHITDLSASTVYRIVGALQKKGFLEKDEVNKSYRLGFKISQLAQTAHEKLEINIKTISKPFMIELLKKYNEDVRLFVEEGSNKLCIESFESTRSLRHIMEVGDKHTLLKGAAGKVILSYMAPDRCEKIIQGTQITEQVLKNIKDKGYALSIGEKEEGIVGIAAPIVNEKNELIAALSLSGPSVRFVNEEIDEKIIDTISTAKKISAAYAARMK